MHAVINTVEEDLAQPSLRHILHHGPGQFLRQQVANHALVAVGCHQCPVVILGHSHEAHVHFAAASLEWLVDGADGVGLLGAVVESGVATMADGDIAFVVDALAGVGCGVGIVEFSLAVVDDGHACPDALVAHDGIPVHVNPHDGQIG